MLNLAKASFAMGYTDYIHAYAICVLCYITLWNIDKCFNSCNSNSLSKMEVKDLLRLLF